MSVRITLNDGSGFLSSDPKNDSMELLIEKTLAAGHPLTFDEARQDMGMIQPNFYAFYYGSFQEAAQRAWKKVKAMLLQENQSEKEENNNMSSHYTLETVKARLIAYYKNHGKMPNQTDAMSNPELPSWTTLMKFLGPKSGWKKLISEESPSIKTGNGPEKSPSPNSPNEVSVPEPPVSEEESESTPQPVLDDDVPEKEPVPTEQAIIIADNTNGTNGTNDTEDTNDEVQIETSEHRNEDAITIEMKLTLPGRSNPISITLKV